MYYVQVFAANFDYVTVVFIPLPEFVAKHVRVHAVTSRQINLQLELFGSIVNGEHLGMQDLLFNCSVGTTHLTKSENEDDFYYG